LYFLLGGQSHVSCEVAVQSEEMNMSTMMMAAGAAPAAVPAAQVAPAGLKLVSAAPIAPVPAEVTFLNDHPLVPVFVIGAIALTLSLMAVGSIVFWLAIRYSGVLAP
jgi:hypothetical protein